MPTLPIFLTVHKCIKLAGNKNDKRVKIISYEEWRWKAVNIYMKRCPIISQ